MDCQTANFRRLKCAHLAISAGYNGWEAGRCRIPGIRRWLSLPRYRIQLWREWNVSGQTPSPAADFHGGISLCGSGTGVYDGQIISPNNGMLI